MAQALYIPSGPVQLSGNPIWVVVANSTIPVGATGYRALLKVTSTDGKLFGAPFVDGIEPDETGAAVFDISAYVDQPFTPAFEWPPVGVATANPASVRFINIQCGFTYIDSTGAQVTTIEGDDYDMQVIKGGISDQRIAEYNADGSDFFDAWIATGKFLTNMPDNLFVSPDQYVKLWFMSKEATTIQAKWNIDIVLEGSDPGHFETSGNVDIYSFLDSLSPTGLVEFTLNPTFIGIPPELTYTRVTSYTFWLTLRAAPYTEISERRTFVVDHTPTENTNYLFAANSISGIDIVRLTGAVRKNIDVSGTEGSKPHGINASPRVGTILTTSKTARRKFVINTGWKSPAEMEGMVDVLLSHHLWLLHNGRLIPVTLANKEQLLHYSMEDQHSMELELLEAHNTRFA